ncbi:helix-turn-helix domain-containing protein [Trinickia mobilis]|uniref:helix-turn-helix domain-containing protein n=1 Tax=Trinickia mobilis TaxID=2816356 RepID=UPI001A8F06B1
MECFAEFHGMPVMPNTHATKRIGIALFDRFALLGAATIAEVFHSANALAASAEQSGERYEVCLLSAAGGRIASSSSMFVWTDSVESQRNADNFHALFIVGGTGAADALRDGRLTIWLRRAYSRSELIFPIAEGRLLLEVVGSDQATDGRGYGGRLADSLRSSTGSAHVPEPAEALRLALSVVQADLGDETARQISNWIAPRAETPFNSIVRKNASVCVSEKIQESARWLEANGDQPVAIDSAAQIAAMSERNFLRRFKMEMGMTPSDYLLHVRLEMSCRLLAETDLPVDKIARRCGIGSGGRLP